MTPSDTPAQTPAAPEGSQGGGGGAPGPARAWRRAGLALALLLLALPPLLAWLTLRSEAGTRWLLARVPGLQVQGLQGALLADSLQIEQLRWQGDAGTLTLDQLRLEGFGWRLLPASGQWLSLQMQQIRADQAVWRSAPPPAEAPPPMVPPSSLRLPLHFETRLALGTLRINDLAPLRELALHLQLGAEGGLAHRIESMALQWDKLQLQSGQLRLGAKAPLTLDGAWQLSASDPVVGPWQARVSVGGSVANLLLEATLRGRGDAALDLRSELAPFANWPLGAVRLRAQSLDLALLASGLPRTRLRGQIDLAAPGSDQGLEATLQWHNDAPGRWHQGSLPLRQLDAVLRANPRQPDQLDIAQLDLRLADANGAAGRWQGQGLWQGHRLSLNTRIDDLSPQRLDARAPAMNLKGPLRLSVLGLPSPDPAASAPVQALSLDLGTELSGRIEGAPMPVAMDLQATLSAGRLDLTTLKLRAGAARASAQAQASLKDGRWAVTSQGELVDFDPLPWWPGPEGSGWRRGPHRLNGSWQADLTAPADAATLALPSLVQQLAGDASLRIDRSRIAGVPLQAEFTLDKEGGATLAARLNLGGNRLRLDGRGDPAGDGRADRWKLELDAPALAALAPLARLAPAAAEWAPRAGRLDLKLDAQGRWPRMQSQGQLLLKGLAAGPLTLAASDLQWQAGSHRDAPLSARLNLSELVYAGQRLPSLQAELDGSLPAHRLQMEAALPVQPPPALAHSLGLPARPGTRVQLRAEGDWADVAGAGRWTGRVLELGVAGWDGRLPLLRGGGGADRWLDARDLRAVLDFDAGGALQRGLVDAGRLKLAGGIGLRWDEVLYDATRGHLQMQAEVESFRVAPFLARWQPTMGWGGDLAVGAKLSLRAAESFDADLVIERLSGDLRVLDAAENAVPLGLSDLRLGLSAHDGTWFFTQALAGRTLGEAGGALRVLTSPARRWPEPEAPLSGTLSARVAQLGVWGAWVPPGWRLEGALSTTATFEGSLGAPQIIGELRGQGLGVRNLLLGVNVRDGDIAVRLQGDKATVERFVLKGGDGQLSLSGGAVLGADPTAQLALQAERFQVLGRIDRRLVTSGKAALVLNRDLLQLTGGIVIDEGLFDVSRADAPSLDDDVIVRRQGDAPAPPVAQASAAPQRKVAVALDVDLGRKLHVRGRGLDTYLSGQLKVSAPGGKLSIVGSVDTVGGTFAAYAQKLDIERGRLSFNGAPDAVRLDVLALRPKTDIQVGVAITGPVLAPRVRLYSDPEMSDTDKLSWLVLGRDPGGLGRSDTALLQRAAMALLSGEGEGPSDGVIRKLGLDELSVRQSDGEVKETIVSIGKQISERWYVGYERGVNATTGTWQMIYRVAQRFTLRLQSGLEDSLDAIWVWRVP